jgi:hypothetical protein
MAAVKMESPIAEKTQPTRFPLAFHKTKDPSARKSSIVPKMGRVSASVVLGHHPNTPPITKVVRRIRPIPVASAAVVPALAVAPSPSLIGAQIGSEALRK